MKIEKPKYKTWIRTRAIIIFIVLTLVSIAGIFFSIISLWFLSFIVPAFIFGYITVIISLSGYMFSEKGGDFQNKIHNLIIGYINPENSAEILDIGCGSGNLSVKIAGKYRDARVTGLDYWGGNWEYSKLQCELNSKLEGVDKQIKFIKGSASNLGIKDGSFDTVVSCLTFHEVRDAGDKLICLSEALRVLKTSGRFIFFDLFLDPRYYPSVDVIKTHIVKYGGDITEFKKIGELIKLPFPLNGKKVLGYGAIIAGIKTGV